MNSSLKQIENESILNLDYTAITPKVLSHEQIPSEMAKKASAICRCRFKPCDILLLCLLDENSEGDSGIVFTNTVLYFWSENDCFRQEVQYSTIAGIEYDSEGILIRLKGDSQIEQPVLNNAFQMLLKNLPTPNQIRMSCYSEDVDPDDGISHIRNMYLFLNGILELTSASENES